MSSRAERSRRLRVCVVAPSLDILGGQAVQADRLVARLRRDGDIDVDLLPINPRLPGPLGLLQRIKYVRTIVTSIAYVALLLRRLGRYDVVHIFSASYLSFLLAPTPAVIVGRLFGRRVVLNYHSGEAEDHLRRSGRTVALVLRMVDALVVPSRYLVDVFAHFGHRAVEVNNFVDVERYLVAPRTLKPPTFLSNRNLERHYGVDVVLRAFARIQTILPDARLVVAGQGRELEALRTLARELGVRHVEFRGRVAPEEMPALYAAADVFLNASLIDNMPLSLLEAAAARVPIVSSDAGGIPYMVAHEETALLVPRGDASALALAALRVVGDRALAARLVAGARRALEAEYIWPVVRARWIEVYGSESCARVPRSQAADARVGVPA